MITLISWERGMCTYDVVSWTEWVDLCLVLVGLEALDRDLAGCQ